MLRGLRDNWSGYEFTSGRLESRGKYATRYGRFECRAILPRGQVSWPAIWALGTSGAWPACGELDIMEQWGNNKRRIPCDSHTAAGASGNIQATFFSFANDTTSVTEFHVYALDWYADSLVFSVDNTPYARISAGVDSPFRANDHYLILNVAIGGTMGGTVDRTNGFPMDMDTRHCASLRSQASIAALCLAGTALGQAISPLLVGNNVWMNPDETVWRLVAECGEGSIRIGGGAYDGSMPANATLLGWVNRIKAMGAEPIMQVPRSWTPQQCADLVTWFNKTQNVRVTYWSIGNEPDLRHGYQGNAPDVRLRLP